MQEEYIIINKTAIQKRLKEAKKHNEKYGAHDLASGSETIVNELTHILSQSAPLIPEIEKAFHEGTRVPFDKSKPLARWWVNVDQRLEDYIANLKINLWT